MNQKPFVFLLLVCLAWVAAACDLGAALTPGSTSKARLDQAEKIWTEQEITHYRLEVLVVNSVWHAQAQQLIVEDNAVTESTATCIPAPTEGGKCEIRAYTADDYTIPGLFAQARSQINSEQVEWIEITYDPTYGFVSEISYDDPDAVDEDWVWRVTAFEPLQ